MNLFSRIVFWIATIALCFVNPLISTVLIVLYYLPRIIQEICQPCNEEQDYEMKSYSDDVLEDMK